MLHRTKKQGDLNRDKWIGIGGKCEEKESPQECMKREFWEETGAHLLDEQYRGLVIFVSDQWETEYMHLFTATKMEGELTSSCPEGDLAWISKSDLRQKNLWQGDHIFLDLLEANAPFFSLKLVYQGDMLQEAVLDGRKLIGFSLPQS